MKIVINFPKEILCFTTTYLNLTKEDGFIIFYKDNYKCYIDDNVTIKELIKKFKSGHVAEFNANSNKILQEKTNEKNKNDSLTCFKLKFKTDTWEFFDV